MTQEDIKYVTELVRQSGSSFYHGMKMLPAGAAGCDVRDLCVLPRGG